MIKEILLFVLGFMSCVFFVYLFHSSSFEIPRVTGFSILNDEVSSPSDRVSSDDIVVLDNKIILYVDSASISSYADTGSMLPFFDEGANGIRIRPEGVDDVQVGDIVSYRKFGSLIVHRVIEKGVDEGGVYFIVKGDNNSISDGKIRFEDIEWITVGIIY